VIIITSIKIGPICNNDWSSAESGWLHWWMVALLPTAATNNPAKAQPGQARLWLTLIYPNP
jgi:hypothetical protein